MLYQLHAFEISTNKLKVIWPHHGFQSFRLKGSPTAHSQWLRFCKAVRFLRFQPQINLNQGCHLTSVHFDLPGMHSMYTLCKIANLHRSKPVYLLIKVYLRCTVHILECKNNIFLNTRETECNIPLYYTLTMKHLLSSSLILPHWKRQPLEILLVLVCFYTYFHTVHIFLVCVLSI